MMIQTKYSLLPKNNVMKNLFLLLTLIIVLGSCKRDPIDYNELALSPQEFAAKYAIRGENFKGKAQDGFAIQGKKGTKVKFPVDAFLDENNNPVSGDVSVHLVELLSKADVLFSGKMTESEGALLVSGGQVLIQATQAGKVLRRSPSKYIEVNVPTTFSEEPMDLFVYEKIETGDSTWAWVEGKPRQPQNNYYTFDLPGFGWINCDYFYNNSSPKTTITSNFNPNGSGYNGAAILSQSIMLVFKDENIIVSLPYSNSVHHYQSYLNSLPIGKSVYIVAIAFDNRNRTYFGTRSTVVAENMHVDIPVNPATQQDIDQFLEQL